MTTSSDSRGFVVIFYDLWYCICIVVILYEISIRHIIY